MSDKSILSDAQISQKIKRMAYEIYENNYDAKEISLVGIKNTGLQLAQSLHAELQKIFPIKYNLIPISLDKKNPHTFNPDLKAESALITDKTVIVIDDVLNSGRTLIYAIKPLLAYKPSSIQVAVLVNRDHKNFPVQPDYIGLSLSTTIKEHVEVLVDSKGAYSAILK